MIYDDIFAADSQYLGHNILKMLEVDLRSGDFFEVKVEDNEEILLRCSKVNINDWVNSFVEAGQVPDEDKQRVLDFFKLNEIERTLNKNWMKRVFYRRLVDGEWRYVSAEFVRMGRIYDEDKYALLVIRDIDDYIKDFRE